MFDFYTSGYLEGKIMAYIKEEDIKAIRESADIVDIISSYLNVSPKGRNYVAVCPFHDDHSPSLVISKERQIFNCFTCRTGGNVFSFVMKYENITFPDAVKLIAEKIGYNLHVDNSQESYRNKFKEEYQIMDYVTKYYMNNLLTSSGATARTYLHNRGISDEIIKEFNIGLADDTNSLIKIANSKKWSIDTLVDLGLVNKIDLNNYDVFNKRIMIPIENLEGQVVGFTGRIYNNEENTAKYMNTKETKIFLKSQILFNYHNARKYIRDEKSVIVVEGNMDAITLASAGIKNCVALMGVALSNMQINTLKKLRVPIILMLDNDTAGEDATIKNGDLLTQNGLNTLVVRLSDAKDPDEYIRTKGIKALKDNINHAIKYIDFKLEYLKKNKNLNNIEDLSIYLKEVLNNISNEDILTKELIISKLSKEYGIDIEILKKSINVNNNIKENNVDKEKKVIKKVNKYSQASHKVLYYMLISEKYIIGYKNKLGYFKELEERVLASEIIYYNKINGEINIADFTSYIIENTECISFLEIIMGENSNTIINDEEFNSCIEAILDIYKKDKIEELKLKIKREMDMEKKTALMNELLEIKKEV